MRARLPGLAWFVGTLALAIQSSPAGSEGQAVGGADMDLLRDVREIAERIEQVRGQRFDRPPVAVRAPETMREVAAEIRAFNVVTRERLQARGRAWADLGLGGPDTPERVLRIVASDLEGVGLDAERNRLLVMPDRLTVEDFVLREGHDATSALLMSAGVRTHEPLVGHALVHVRQIERGDGGWLAETTDELLARAAWAEGEANLVAVRYLFEGMGLQDEVLRFELDPGTFLDGILLPKGYSVVAGVEAELVRFIYYEGFAEATRSYAAGGWPEVDRAMARVRTSRDFLHPGQERPPAPRAGAPTPPAAGLELADTDSLGELGVILVVSRATGKDNLGLQAGDGWVADRLYRWESADGKGVTEWQTDWRSPGDAADFAYALGRVIRARFPGHDPVEPEEGIREWRTPERRFRFRLSGTSARLLVFPVSAAAPPPASGNADRGVSRLP